MSSEKARHNLKAANDMIDQKTSRIAELESELARGGQSSENLTCELQIERENLGRAKEVQMSSALRILQLAADEQTVLPETGSVDSQK